MVERRPKNPPRLTREECKRLISETESLINTKTETRRVLRKTATELDAHITRCNIASTAGNGANIAGTALLFSPFALVGVGILIAGAVTTAGTGITQNSIEKSYFNDCKSALANDENRTAEYDQIVDAGQLQKIGKAVFDLTRSGYQFVQSATLARDIFRGFNIMLSVAPEAVLTVNGVSGAAAFLNLGRVSFSSAAGVLGVVGAGVSVYSIIDTWTSDNSTVTKINKLADSKTEEIQGLQERLELLREIYPRL